MEQAIRIEPPRPQETHSQYAYRNIRQNIMELHLKPGELINEAELAAAMGVSRTPVHEAVMSLRDEKLIDVIPRKESRVSYINMALVNEGVFLRCSFEPALLKSLAGHVAPGYLQKMRENLELQNALFQSKKDLAAYYPADDEFHRLMYMAANKPQIYGAMRTICAHLDRMRFLVRLENDVDIEQMSLEEHRQMLLYLMLGVEPQEDLEQLFQRHIMRFQKKLPKYLEHYHDFFVLESEDAPMPGLLAFENGTEAQE